MSDIRSRIDKLEKEAPSVPDDTEAPPAIILCWPEEETEEIRRHNRAVRRWYRDHGAGPSKVVVNWDEPLTWPDGTEALAP